MGYFKSYRLAVAALALSLAVGSVSAGDKAGLGVRTSKPNADANGDGIADSYVWYGETRTAEGKALPVLMVISNQDFYYQEISETRVVGRVENRRVEMRGTAVYGKIVNGEHHVAAICHGVTVLAWARVDGSSSHLPILQCADDDARRLILALTLIL